MDNFILSPIPLADLQSKIAECVKREVQSILNTLPVTQGKEELISRKEAAAILHISLPTLNEWTKNGVIPAYRIGSFVRYKRSELGSSLNKVKAGASKKN